MTPSLKSPLLDLLGRVRRHVGVGHAGAGSGEGQGRRCQYREMPPTSSGSVTGIPSGTEGGVVVGRAEATCNWERSQVSADVSSASRPCQSIRLDGRSTWAARQRVARSVGARQ